jgi:hypothetical protein
VAVERPGRWPPTANSEAPRAEEEGGSGASRRASAPLDADDQPSPRDDAEAWNQWAGRHPRRAAAAPAKVSLLTGEPPQAPPAPIGHARFAPLAPLAKSGAPASFAPPAVHGEAPADAVKPYVARDDTWAYPGRHALRRRALAGGRPRRPAPGVKPLSHG